MSTATTTSLHPCMSEGEHRLGGGECFVHILTAHIELVILLGMIICIVGANLKLPICNPMSLELMSKPHE